jgi:cell wall-associated NlpC family hydrolase
MIKILYIIAISNLLLASNIDCNLHLSVLKPTNSQIKIIISHDKNCTVTIEDTNRTITINSDVNESIEDKDKTLSLEESIINLAKSNIGVKYRTGGANPKSGFDCSGFVYYIFKENNISIPRTSKMQSKAGETLGRDEIKVGDILSFDTTNAGHINHSGVYLGNGKFIHASSGRAKSVTVSKLDKGFYKDKFRWGVRVKSN